MINGKSRQYEVKVIQVHFDLIKMSIHVTLVGNDSYCLDLPLIIRFIHVLVKLSLDFNHFTPKKQNKNVHCELTIYYIWILSHSYILSSIHTCIHISIML